MLRSQLRTPGSGTVIVTTPTPEKAPPGIFTVQSPFFSTPPTSPFTVPVTTWEAVEDTCPEPETVGSTGKLWTWPEGCSGETGEDEHPAMKRSIAMVGSVPMRDPRMDLKWVPPLFRASYRVSPGCLMDAHGGWGTGGRAAYVPREAVRPRALCPGRNAAMSLRGAEDEAGKMRILRGVQNILSEDSRLRGYSPQGLGHSPRPDATPPAAETSTEGPAGTPESTQEGKARQGRYSIMSKASIAFAALLLIPTLGISSTEQAPSKPPITAQQFVK